MPFDLSSAAPVDAPSRGGFDLASAKPVEAPKPPTARSTEGQATPIAGIEDVGGEAYNIARGAIMGPLGNVAGLAAIPLHAAGAISTPPIDVQRKVAGAGAYTPQTAVGRTMEKFGPSALIGKAAEAAGGAVEKSPIFAGHPIAASIAGYGTKGAIEQAPALLGAKAGGKIAEGIPGKQAALDVAKGENAIKDTTRDTARDAGYRPPPEHGLQALASGVVGKTKAEKLVSEHNEQNATRRLSSEVGAPEGSALSAEEFERLKSDAGKDYDGLAQAAGPKLQVTNDFRDAVRGTLDKVNATIDVNPSLRPAQRILAGFLKRVSPKDPSLQPRPGKGGPPILGTIEKAATEQPGPPIMRTLEQASSDTPGAHAYGEAGPSSAPSMPVPTGTTPTLSTKWVMGQISDLRRNAKDDFRKNDSDSGTTRLGLANQLENLVEENLSTTNKGLVDQFRAARERFAKIYLLERITNDATGRVSLPKLASLSESKAYKGVLTGEFKTAADFAKTFRKGAQRSTGEAPPRLTVFDGLFGLGSMVAGHAGYGAMELAARLGIPALAERGMLQNRTPSYQVGKARRGLPYALPAAGAAISGQLDQPPQ